MIHKKKKKDFFSKIKTILIFEIKQQRKGVREMLIDLEIKIEQERE